MSYQVLARKWRPQTFSELVGQTHVVKAISNALNNDKLHHAYLFTGTRGVGKTTIARIFAKSINCEEGQSDQPCGKCGTCLDINQGRYVDLLEIDAASRTKVEDTRELLDNVQYKPTRGRYKIYLIDEVHMLSKHSFNALLKTLEEPPEHVKFLLATTDPQKLPVTVLSRCLQFNLKQLNREQITEQLTHILQQEHIDFEKPALPLLASAANGSMRDALSLTDQAIAQGNNSIVKSDVINMLGLLDNTLILKIVKSLLDSDYDDCMKMFNRLCEDAPDFSQFLSQLMACLHQINLTQLVPDVCKLENSHPKAIYVLAKSANTEHIQLLYQIALQGKRDLPFAPDPRTGVQMTLLRMLAFSPVPTQTISPDDFKLSIDHANPEPQAEQQDNVTLPYSDSEIPEASVPAANKVVPEPVVTPEVAEFDNGDVPSEPIETSAQYEQEQNHIEHQSEPESDSGVAHQPQEKTQDQLLLEKTRQNMEALDDLLQLDPKEGSGESSKKSEQINTPAIRDEKHSEHTSLPLTQLAERIQPKLSSGEKLLNAAQIDQWSSLVDELEVKGLSRQLLLHSRLEKIDSDCFISVDENSGHLVEESIILNVQDALSKKYGKAMKLYIEKGVVENSPIQIQEKINQMRQQFARQVVEQDDTIQHIINAFDAKIIDSSIEPK